MAIVTISRIQHRRGLKENLPQLSAAELGWAVDERKLYIGNGPVSEGAPAPGNTQILTEYSNILETAQTYSFKNSNSGFIASTGPSANSPIVRTLQNKLDDMVSVLDFGAKGDGATDDTAAINKALHELYCTQTFPSTNRRLYFPAGIYIVSNYIRVPPNATLIGEGPTNTIIRQTGNPNTITCVMQTADSLQQIGGSIGTNANLPADIMISDMCLEANLDGIYIYNTKRITLSRVKIVGKDNRPATSLTSVAVTTPTSSKALYIAGSAVQPSEDINLVDCYLTKFNFGILQDDVDQFFQNIMITSATWENLYNGISLNLNNGISKNITVTSSVFNNIFEQAVNLGNVDNFASSFNYYQNVGNHYLGSGNPASSIINFGTLTNHSASLGDLFDRPDADDLNYPRIVGNGNTSNFQYGHVMGIGYLAQETGLKTDLSDATTNGATPLSMNLTRYKHAQITYKIIRTGASRSGVLNIAFNGSSYIIDDDSTETGDVGVTFDIANDGTTAILRYTTTSTGATATLHYAVKRLTDVV